MDDGNEPLWVRRWTEHPELGELRLAAEARERAAYLLKPSGQAWQLHTWDAEAQRGRPLTDPTTPITQFGLSGDGQEVWWFDETQSGGEAGRWYRAPYDGSTPGEEIPGLPAGFWYGGLGIGRDTAAVGVVVDGDILIHRVPRGGAAVELCRYQPGARIRAVSLDGTRVAVAHRSGTDPLHPAIDVLDLATGEPVLKLPPSRAVFYRSAQFSPDGTRLVYQEERDGWLGLSIAELDTGAPPYAVPALSWPPKAELSGYWLPDGKSLFIVAVRGMQTSYHRWELGSLEPVEVEFPKIRNPHYLAHGEGDVATPTIGPDGEVLCLLSSSSRPPRYEAILPDSVSFRRWTNLPRSGMPASEPLTEHTARRPGTEYPTVPVAVTEPPGPRPLGGHPSVFLIHGGPHLRDGDTFDNKRAAFVEAGYAVIQPNYRGSAGFGGEWTEALLKNPGFGELEDVAIAWEWAVCKGIADPKKCAIVGASAGGYVALMAAVHQPELWSAVVSEVPFIPTAEEFGSFTPTLQSVIAHRLGATPDENPWIYAERSPLSNLESIACPVLVLAGASDPRSPNGPIVRGVREARALKRQVFYSEAPGGHLATDAAAQLSSTGAALQFVGKHVPTNPRGFTVRRWAVPPRHSPVGRLVERRITRVPR